MFKKTSSEDEIKKTRDAVDVMKNRIKEYGWGPVFIYVQRNTDMQNIFIIAYVELVNEGHLTS